ncbi:hypothetical protein Tco_0565577 [Tanacetum coccineum]
MILLRSDDDSPYGEDIDYVDASPPDAEIVSLEVVENVIPESSSTSLNLFLEETNTFDNSLPESETFCFDLEENSSGSTTLLLIILFGCMKKSNFYLDDDHVEEKSSGSTTTHADFSQYDSFIFDLSINPCPPADRSDCYDEVFAGELAQIISPPEYDCFYFKNEPELGEFTMDVVEDIFDNQTREPREHGPNVLPTHPTLHLGDSDFTLYSRFPGFEHCSSFPVWELEYRYFDTGIFIGVQSIIFLSPDEFSFSFIRDPPLPVIDTLLPFSSKNEKQRKDLKQEVIMKIPEVEGTGHINVSIQVEYDWKPSLCNECHVFGHSLEQCLKRVVTEFKEGIGDEGFTKVNHKRDEPQQKALNNKDRPANSRSDETKSIPIRNYFDFLNVEDTRLENAELSHATSSFTNDPGDDDDEEIEEDYVEDLEVSDVNSTGLRFTWNQKPKGDDGILKKIDRIMENLEFNTTFVVVKRLKLLRKPLRKLLRDHGNLHDNVTKLRHELDEAQKALDVNPNNLELREEDLKDQKRTKNMLYLYVFTYIVQETDIQEKDEKSSQKRQNRARERKEHERKVKSKPKVNQSQPRKPKLSKVDPPVPT